MRWPRLAAISVASCSIWTPMWLSDQTVNRLQQTLGLPDLSGTKYQLIEEIGRGGMGTGYLARDVELEREVALKVLHRPDASSLRESRHLARPQNPRNSPPHDVGTLCGVR